MVTAVDNNTANAPTSKSTTAAQAANQNYQDFLKLLTVQLQNQDPTAPADTDQLTQQIATLSQVEQQIATNSNLEKLLNAYNTTQIASTVSYIGKQVDVDGNSTSLKGGQAWMGYNLDQTAAKVTVTIKNSAGQTVFTGEGSKDAGRNELIWDGKDANGVKMPDGTYTFSVKAEDQTGNKVEASPFTTGVVTSLDTKNGKTSLFIGDLEVELEDVISVRDVIQA
ncbi:MAG: flagellar hook assembly protein FlgD [Rickettsiales bacterium]|nr:flagellar hook assembly protein FlgD [Rickettsiales bacterium]